MTNIGVIGCGYWGPNLVRNFTSLSDARVKRICDLDEVRLGYMKKLYPQVEVTTDFDSLVRDDEIDAVVIATPVSVHYEMAMKSIEAGKHTMIEKPMAASSQECMNLIETAEKKDVRLMVGHTFIFTPTVRRIKTLISQGDIGEILYISSRRLNLGLFQKDINVAWDLAPHDISIILYLMGKEPVAVNCQGKCHMNTAIEDVTSMSLDFENGGFAVIQSSWLDPNKVREMIIVGSRRMIVYDDTQPLEKVKIFDKRVDPPPHYDTFAEFHFSYHYGDIYTPYIKHEEPLKVECQHFIDCIMRGERPETSGQEGLRVVQILEAASSSLKQGGNRVALHEPALVT
ncbi:MAG: Gfo/Idh/MocA family protein, partial [Spirochaetota bacterium]